MDELKKLYEGERVTNYDLTHNDFRVNNLLPYFGDTSKLNVVDFGCGTGLVCQTLNNNFNTYTGIDFSEEFIEIAEEKFESDKISFVADDIVEYCKNIHDKFDVVFTIDFSEHIYDETFRNIYSSAYQVLKSGGKLYLHTPNGNYFIELLKKWGILKQFIDHVAVRNEKENLELLKKAGFTNIKVYRLPHYLKPFNYLHLLSKLPFISSFFVARLLIVCTK